MLAKGPKDDPTGPTYLAALDRFRKLLSLEKDKGTDDYLVSALFNQYRTYLHATRKSSVPNIFEVLARGFVEEFGAKRVCELQPHMMETWLAGQHNWNNTSKAHAGALILGAVSWARRKGYIQNDPLAGRVDLPQPILRGREARMAPALMDLLIGEAKANRHKSTEFSDLLWALRLTGARPGEIRNAEAHNYHVGKLIFRWNTTVGYVHKNAKKSQRDRIIFLTPELQTHIEGLVARYPTGPLFRTPRGKKWSLTSIANNWARLMKRPPIVAYCRKHDINPKSLKMYNFRHTLISDYLDATGDIYGIAQMCGTSVAMVSRRYGHPDVGKLHDAFLRYHAGNVA